MATVLSWLGRWNGGARGEPVARRGALHTWICAAIFGCGAAVFVPGCKSSSSTMRVDQSGNAAGSSVAPASTSRRSAEGPPIRAVRCLYERKPWLNLDDARDSAYEGIRYRVFLDPGTGRGVPREGMFHINMYRIDRLSVDKTERTLVSDWHYPTDAVHRIAKPGMLGDGYFLYLGWADDSVAGKEIELVTEFEDVDGATARSGSKRLRVPRRSP